MTPAPVAAVAPRVVLGVGGGIAAYKACEVLRRLTESGAEVTVVPTASALHFVGAATFAALSGRPVHTEVWDDVHQVPHVRLGREADLVLVVPTTADLLARAAQGRADDLLTAVLLTARAPVVMAPAMHTEMWEHPAVRANVALLRDRGVHVVDPDVGRLTGADSGAGRLPDPGRIADLAQDLLDATRHAADGTLEDLAGRHVVVSAGGTREDLDPVRFLGNRSSGRQGYALARAALARGARVTLVSANPTLPEPLGAAVVPVRSALELRDAVLGLAETADAVVMAAAVADFRPRTRAEHKLKKTDDHSVPELALEQTPDVLATLVAARAGGPSPVLVGFAAETGRDREHTLRLGQEKLARKGCDVLVVNDVGDGRAFDVDVNEAVLIDADGVLATVPLGPKSDVAHAVLDQVRDRTGRSAR